MKYKSIFSRSFALGLAMMAGVSLSGMQMASAEETAPAAEATAEQQMPPQNEYKYVSQEYGYSMKLPMKPLGVLPASVVFKDEQDVRGEVLVFDNEEYNIKKAVVVLVDAFLPDDIPDGIMQASDNEKQKAIDKFMEKGLFDVARLASLGNGKTAMYCVSAKEIEVDTTGDGVADEVMEADSQMIMTYFKGEYGGRFMVGWLENPTITNDGRYQYDLALLSFQQWPTVNAKK